jgi:hypothetical protein
MKKWMIGSGLVAAAALTVLYFVTAPSDEVLIRRAITDATQASREGRPGPVLDYLSKLFTFNGVPIMDRGEISKYVRLARPDIEFGPFEPEVSGDQAVVVADVHVKFSFQGAGIDQTIPNVRIQLARESGLRWLVLPGKKWRVTEVTAPELAQFADGAP